MRTTTRNWLSVLVVTVAWTVAACGDNGTAAVDADTGTLRLPLVTTTPSGGVTYRLADAVFQITNYANGYSAAVSGNDATLVVDLPPSVFSFDYFIVLQDGWTLYEVSPGGSERPVAATLLNNFQSFTIKSQRTTPLYFQFKAGSFVVTIGDGTLSVNVTVDDTLVDDFEDGDGALPAIGGRRGTWVTFNDTTGTQTPAAGTPVIPEVVDASATYVLHETGSGFAVQGPLPNGAFAFGAGVGVNINQDPLTGMPRPYDASSYDGIGFNFRYAFPSDLVPLQILGFYVGTSATTPVAEGGTCTANCYDDYAFIGSISFSPEFFSGFFRWSDLRQQGFGTPVPFDPATIISFKWIVQFPDFGQAVSANTFDFQLDNLTFVRTPPLDHDASAVSATAMASWTRSTLGAGQRGR
jgi:hypothetical protein